MRKSPKVFYHKPLNTIFKWKIFNNRGIWTLWWRQKQLMQATLIHVSRSLGITAIFQYSQISYAIAHRGQDSAVMNRFLSSTLVVKLPSQLFSKTVLMSGQEMYLNIIYYMREHTAGPCVLLRRRITVTRNSILYRQPVITLLASRYLLIKQKALEEWSRSLDRHTHTHTNRRITIKDPSATRCAPWSLQKGVFYKFPVWWFRTEILGYTSLPALRNKQAFLFK